MKVSKEGIALQVWNFLQSHLGSHLLTKGLMCSPNIKQTLTSELVWGYLLTCMFEADCPFTVLTPNRFTLQNQIILMYVCYIKGFSKVLMGLIWLQLTYFHYDNIQFRDTTCPEMERNQIILLSLLLTSYTPPHHSKFERY